MIDAHGHVLGLGFTSTQVALFGTESLEEAQDRIRAYAAANLDRAWLLGGGWNQVKWKLGRFPRQTELDAACADRPVVLWRIDHHAEWLNSKALSAAGISKITPDPLGGRIERDEDGNPTGVLVDKAMALIDGVVPRPSDSELSAALNAAQSQLNSVGITSVADPGDPVDSVGRIALYKSFADRHLLTVRLYAMIWETGEDFRLLSKNGPVLGYGDDFLTVRSVKLLADGALGSRGAALMAPYSDKPDQRGLLFMSQLGDAD